jgi:DnaJ domain
MTHSYQFDPYLVLGVTSGASLREIRDAYHQKSLKHHPDRGGDEWAFRIVARAYEILTTARVVDRASDEVRRPATSRPYPTAYPEPESEAENEARPRATWTNGFGPEAASTKPGTDPDSTTTLLKGWGGPPRSHAEQSPTDAARIVTAELLILRFELECSLDLFTRRAEDRNLSCSLHVTWPVAELADRAQVLPNAPKTLKRIGEAFKGRDVRKHALKKQSSVENGRFEGWLTYPTAVMASEALEAFREALAKHGLEVEKQTREMAIPRPRG